MGIQINGNTNNINAGIGSLSIEDLREIDIVGVATASNFKTGVSDLHSVGLTLSGGQLDVGNNIKLGNAGVITATSFVGSGANLTGIDATQIVTGNTSVQTVDTGSDGHVKINTEGSERLRITSTGQVGINSASPAATLDIHDLGSTGPCLLIRGGSSTEGDIVIPDGEALTVGHWNYGSSSYTERLRMYSTGNAYFTEGISIGNGGTAFSATGGNGIHIQDGASGTGILLKQTGDNYNLINGDANRSGSGTSLLDIRGTWNGTQVARIRFDTGDDTTNKDNGELQFFTSNSGSVTERMKIQANGEIAMRSSGTPSDALANLHVQNETFRVSNDSDGADTTYVSITAQAHGSDQDLNIIKHVKNNIIQNQFTGHGRIFSSSHHYVGRTRTDANSPINYYFNGSYGFHAYSGRSDDTTNYRTVMFMRAWDGGDTADRNAVYFVNSESDTTTADYDQHQKFGIKANGMAQFGNHVFAGRVESDEGSPNSVYSGASGTGFIAYPNTSAQQTSVRARTSDNSTDHVFYADTGGGLVHKFTSNGNLYFDGGLSGPATDYAEMFEWTDGNSSNVDRRGITVVMDEEKIRPATNSDDTSKIIGVVSAQPTVCGDDAWSEWKGKHQRDIYGGFVTEDKEYLVWNKFGSFIDKDGVKKPNPQPNIDDPNVNPEYQIPVSDIEKEKAAGTCPQAAIDQNLRITSKERTINPNWDPSQIYIPRKERKEWDAIGLLGKLVVRRGQPIGANWILMKSNIGVDPNDSNIILDKYFVR